MVAVYEAHNYAGEFGATEELIAVTARALWNSGDIRAKISAAALDINYPSVTQFFVFISALDTVRDSPSLSTSVSFYFTYRRAR